MSPKNPRKSYHQWCPVASALDQVGDRWTFLIIRDLLTGDRRFSDLRSELGGISPTLLSTRLRDLANDGLVVQTGTRYSITDRGRALDDVIHALGRWGAPITDVPKRTDHVPRDYRVTALNALIKADRLVGQELVATVIIDGEPLSLRCGTDGATVCAGEAEGAHTTITATMMGLFSIQSGRAIPEDADRAGTVRFSGDDVAEKNFLNLILP